MINPNVAYVGIANFDPDDGATPFTIAGEFSSSKFIAATDSTPLPAVSYAIQTIEWQMIPCQSLGN